MLSDPLTSPASFPFGPSFSCISREKNKSVYRNTASSGNEVVTITVSHSPTKNRQRTLVRMDVNDVANDPMYPSNQLPRSVSAYLVVDFNPSQTVNSDAMRVVEGLMGALEVVASHANFTGTRLERIVSGES